MLIYGILTLVTLPLANGLQWIQGHVWFCHGPSNFSAGCALHATVADMGPDDAL